MMRLVAILAMFTLFTSLGCTTSDVTTSTEPVDATEVAFNVEGHPTIEIDTAGVECEHCAASACELLVDVPGVEDVKADPETKKITVAIDEAEFDRETALSKLRENELFSDAELAEAEETPAPKAGNAGA